MWKRLVPQRWRRQVRRQGYQGAEVAELLLLDVQGALGRYRRGEVSLKALQQAVLESCLLTVMRLLLEEGEPGEGPQGF
jgi:hypothetical protein